MKILMVHGRGQAASNPLRLKQDWLAGLARGCVDAGVARPDPSGIVSFPYYGDLLESLVRCVDKPPELIERGEARGGPNEEDSDPDFLAFRQAVADEVAEQACTAVNLTVADVARELPDSVQERGPQNWGWVQAILRHLDAHYPKFSDFLIDRVTRDVWTYLTYPGIRDKIDALVAAELSEHPTIVVGHSLGSVITYSVLRRQTAVDVPLYVTLGSPLGLRAISRRFTPLQYPPCVRDWFNAYDPKDVVALRGLDATNFPVNCVIRNTGTLINGSPNRHDVVNYLADPTVAGEIAGAFAAVPRLF